MSKTEETKDTRTATPKDSKGQEPAKSSAPGGRSYESGMVPYQRGQSPAQGGGWGPMARWREEFDRYFDQFARGWLGIPVSRLEGGWNLDVREDDNNVMVRAEAPGFDPNDFDIQVRGDQLILRASRKSEKQERDGEFREWRKHDYFQSVTLPTDVDANKVKANYRHGVLSITLPKSEEMRAHKINVEG